MIKKLTPIFQGETLERPLLLASGGRGGEVGGSPTEPQPQWRPQWRLSVYKSSDQRA